MSLANKLVCKSVLINVKACQKSVSTGAEEERMNLIIRASDKRGYMQLQSVIIEVKSGFIYSSLGDLTF